MKAGQKIPAESADHLNQMETQNPETFDDLAVRRRWSSVCKNPDIGMK